MSTDECGCGNVTRWRGGLSYQCFVVFLFEGTHCEEVLQVVACRAVKLEVARLGVMDVVFEETHAVLVLLKTKTGKLKVQLSVVRDRRVDAMVGVESK